MKSPYAITNAKDSTPWFDRQTSQRTLLSVTVRPKDLNVRKLPDQAFEGE